MSEHEQPKRALQFRPLTPREIQVAEDMRFASLNEEWEQQYRGRVIAVRQKQVVAHADTDGELLQQLKAAGLAVEEVAIVGYPSFFETPH